MGIKYLRRGSLTAFILVAILGALGALVCVPDVHAANTMPTTMNFQGRLTDASGNLVANGSYNVKFTIYNAGSTAIWTETRETTNRVVVTNGLFSVQLGSVTALTPSLFTTTGLTLGVTMANPATATCSTAACQTWEAEMTPRSPIATSAYAFNADAIDGIDGASLAQLGANTFTENQTISATSTAALSVGTLLTVDTTNSLVKVGTSGTATNGATVRLLSTAAEFSTSVRIGDAKNSVVITTSGVGLRGTAQRTVKETLSPEYPGATFMGSGSGNLTSDFCSATGRLGLNTTACPTAGDEHNYYTWTSSSTGTNVYTIYVRYQVPSNFASGSLSNVYMYGWRTGATETLNLSLYQANGALCGTTTNVATGTSVWTETPMVGTLSSCTIAAGDMVTFKIDLSAGTNTNMVRAGEIRLNYKTAF